MSVKPVANTPKKKPDETPEARFKRLGTKRIRAAVKRIQLVGNLSGPGYYYTPAQVDTLRKALQDGVDSAMARFDRQKKEELDIEL